MSQLEELKRQRKELDTQIRALQAEQQEIICGDCTLRFYNKNYPQLNDKINLSVRRYGAFKRPSNKQTIFYGTIYIAVASLMYESQFKICFICLPAA